MNRVAFTIVQVLLLLIFFVFDKSSAGVFRIFDIFSLSVLFLIILLNLNSSRSFITVFFLFGFLVDWYNKSFLGMSSMISITILFVYNLVMRRFAGNKATMFALNFATAFIMFQIWNGLPGIFNLQAFAFAIISTGLTSFLWYRG